MLAGNIYVQLFSCYSFGDADIQAKINEALFPFVNKLLLVQELVPHPDAPNKCGLMYGSMLMLIVATARPGR